MKILAICYMGMNRSKYLANFLTGQGLEADCAGILPETKNIVTQERVDRSDVLIFVQPRIREKFFLKFRANKQIIITLEVEDRLDKICPELVTPSPETITEIYRSKVYPALEKQLEPYLESLRNQKDP